MWRYVRALDTNNADAYAAAYTPDGQFGSGANATKGREALKKMIADLRERSAAATTGEPRPPMYHVITNPNVEFVDKDHARYQAYWMTVFGSGGANTPTRVAAAGREYDELVRVTPVPEEPTNSFLPSGTRYRGRLRRWYRPSPGSLRR